MHRLRHLSPSPMPLARTTLSGMIPHRRIHGGHSRREPSFSALASSMISVIEGSRFAFHAVHLQRRCSSSSGSYLSQYGHTRVGRRPLSFARTAVHMAHVRAPLRMDLSSSAGQVCR